MPYDRESDAANIQGNLNCVHTGSVVVFLPEIDSTNNLIKPTSPTVLMRVWSPLPSLKQGAGAEWEESGIPP